jgi:hypothetical protein
VEQWAIVDQTRLIILWWYWRTLSMQRERSARWFELIIIAHLTIIGKVQWTLIDRIRHSLIRSLF